MSYLFTALWGIGGIVLTTWKKLYDVEDYVHVYIITALIVFNLVYALSHKKCNVSFEPDWELSGFKYYTILVLHAVCYALIIPVFIAAISIIQNFGWMEIRSMAYGESSIMSGFLFKVYSWFITPVFTTTGLIAMISLFTSERHKKILLILGVIDMILVTISFGGRYALVRMAIFFLACFIAKRHLTFDNSKLPTKFIFMGMVVLYFLFYMTINRSLHGLSFAENIFVYFYGSFAYFSIITSSPVYAFEHSSLYYGNETFGFITSLPQLIAYKFTNINNTPEYIQDLASNDFLEIGPDIRYNALTTVLYPMWLDGRLFGVIIGFAFFAIALNYLKTNAIMKQSMTYYALYIFMIFVIITSTLTYSLITVQHTITLAMIIFLTNNSIYKKWQ